MADIKQIKVGSTTYNIDADKLDGKHASEFQQIYKYGGTGSPTKIKININSTASWMLCFTVTLYQGYRATKVMISGYNYGTNHWYQPEARLIADSDNAETISVYFGYDSNWNLWVGFDGGDYTGVSIDDVTNGYTQINDFSNLFTITSVTSLTTIQSTATAASRANYANNADTVDGLHVHAGRNFDANKIVRTDDNGYIQCGYINSSYGDEGNYSSPARIWGTNGSDSYLRTYRSDYVNVGSANIPYGFSARTSSSSWSSASNNDGYTNVITGWSDSYGGDIVFKDNGNGALSCEIDGYFYQGCDGHGSSRVADLTDLASYLPLSGGTMTGNLVFKKNGSTIPDIRFQGSQATYTMIRFLDNTGDAYGNGISIGGGGAVVIGAGESADEIVNGAGVSGGTETLYLGSDNNIYLLTNVQSGYAYAKTFSFDTSGNLSVPGAISEGGQLLSNKYQAKGTYVNTVNSKSGAVTVSGSFSGTKTNALVTGVSVNSQGSVTLTANDATATGRITYVQSISGSAPSLGGTTTFVTGYGSFSGGSGSLTSNDTSSGGIAYIASHTNASLGTPSTGTVGISGASYTPAGSVTVTSTRTTSGSGDAARRVLTITSSFSGTAATITPSLTGTKTFVTGYPNFSGGGSTTKYLHHAHTGASLGTASTGTVSISGGSYSATTKYLSASHSGTTLTVSKGDYTPAGSVTISATN